jgi:hypothetical protein
MARQLDPPGYHVVEDGDWLSKIAVWYGFAKWTTIWDAPQNASLRKARNPNLIYPGDQIWIPAATARVESLPTEAPHAVAIKATPDAISIVLQDGKSISRSGVDYEFTMGTATMGKGTTAADGKVHSTVPSRHDPALLHIAKVEVDLRIGLLNPMDADTPDAGVSGVQARLNNLGLRAGAEDGVLGPRTKRSVLLFQKLEKLKEDGTISDDLRDALRKRHGI